MSSRTVPLLIVIVLVSAAGLVAQDLAVSYEIEVSLEPGTHRLEGSQQVRWTNTTGAPATELRFHLYLNAFANRHTTFMRELGSGTLRSGRDMEMRWGWIRMTRLATVEGTDLLPELEYIRPDDGNPDDFTVARVVLPRPMLPGEAIRLEIDFEAQLPRVLARTGHAGDFHLVGQWYPKLGVYERVLTEEGEGAEWNCHQFHANSEFYADFASYKVSISVPAGWVVGAAGVELFDEVVGEGEAQRRRVVHRAERVHDFAWCTAPGELMEVVEADFDPARHVPQQWLELASERLQLSPAELELPPAHLRLLLPRTQHRLRERMLRAARLSVAWFGLFYGPYPYPQLTIVSPPPSAGEAGGMEYPTFITTGGSRLMASPLLSWRSTIETVTVHEFGHQYFQGQLASNEFEQAWLDEGMTSYAELECMTAILEGGFAPEVMLGSLWARERLAAGFGKEPVKIDRQSWQYRRRWDYFRASYSKTAVALKTLENLVGADVFARAMRDYVDTYRFAHPDGQDFFTTFTQAAGEDLGWFFDQAFLGDHVVDWAVLSVRNRQSPERVGFWRQEGQWHEVDQDDEDDGDGEEIWSVDVHLGRRGEFVGPVQVLLVFADGREELRTWDGRDRWVRWVFDSQEKLEQVVMDPNVVWALESRRADNYWRSRAPDKPHGIGGWWLTASLRALSALTLPWI